MTGDVSMKIHIKTDNAAFHSDDDLLNKYMMAEQLSGIFRNIINKIREGNDSGKELDINGNVVCHWEM